MGMRDGIRFCDACGASAGPGEQLIQSGGAWFCPDCAAMDAQCSATAVPATARNCEEVAAAVPPPAVVISKKIYWTGIVALILGLAAGIGVAWLVYDVDQSDKARSARHEIEMRAFQRESDRFDRRMRNSGYSATVQALEDQVDKGEEKEAQIRDRLYAQEIMTRDPLWGRAALPMAILGGLVICPIMLILAIMTRKAPIGLGKTALIFFLSAAGSFGAVSGFVDYGSQQMHSILIQTTNNS
jgi:hypothetical protein